MPGENPDIDALFRLPLEEFTAARNALATRLDEAGHADAASRVKAIQKPPLSAWAVNQLYWGHSRAFDALLATGERLRRVQASSLRTAGGKGKGGGLRDAMEARRAAVADLTTRAGALLEATGHSPTPDITRRITTTLDALATYGRRTDGPRPGRLTDDVEAPGIEVLAALVTGEEKRGGPSRVIPFAQREADRKGREPDPEAERRRRDAERKALAAAVHEAERALADARKSASRAEAALKQAAARAKAAEEKRNALAAHFEKLSADAEGTRQEARRVAATAEEAAQAVADAERALEDARRARDARD
jgi:hypothetical protein